MLNITYDDIIKFMDVAELTAQQVNDFIFWFDADEEIIRAGYEADQ